MNKKTIFSALVGITLWCTCAHADGLGLFAAYLAPSDGQEISGIGIRGRGGMDLLYFELRGTFFEKISELGFLSDQDLFIFPVDFGVGLHTDYEQPIQIYGGVGFTYYVLDIDDGSVDNALGYYLQVGGELEITKGFGFFIEGIWRSIDSEVDGKDHSLEGNTVHVGILLRR